MSVNWGLSGGSSFGNALNFGMQIGADLRQRRDQKEQQSAFSAYATNPTREGLATVAPYSPEFAIREGARFDQMDAAKEQRRQADVGTMRQLLQQAKTDPLKALSAAQSMGIDVSRIPAPESPEFQPWVDQQLFIADAMSEHEDKLPGIAQELVAAGLKPGTADFENALKQAINGKYGTDYYDPASGAMRRRGVFDSGAGSGLYVGKEVSGHKYKGGNPNDPGSWEAAGGQTATPSATFSGNFRGLPGERVTSGYRDPAHNRAVGGVGNSFHTRKDAQGRPLGRDSVPPPGMSMSAYHARLKALNPDKDVINEGDHVHMEPRG